MCVCLSSHGYNMKFQQSKTANSTISLKSSYSIYRRIGWGDKREGWPGVGNRKPFDSCLQFPLNRKSFSVPRPCSPFNKKKKKKFKKTTFQSICARCRYSVFQTFTNTKEIMLSLLCLLYLKCWGVWVDESFWLEKVTNITRTVWLQNTNKFRSPPFRRGEGVKGVIF